jgi:hypothetical protein
VEERVAGRHAEHGEEEQGPPVGDQPVHDDHQHDDHQQGGPHGRRAEDADELVVAC